MMMRWLSGFQKFLRWSFWEPTHIHNKTGGRYRLIRAALLEKTFEEVVIYESDSGTVWVRPKSEFYDGRFKKLTTLKDIFGIK
jgi:hypothetical protein